MSHPRPSLLVVQIQAARRAILVGVVTLTPLVIAPDLTMDPFNVPKLGLLIAGVSLVLGLHILGFAAGENPQALRDAWVVPIAILLPLTIAWAMSSQRTWSLLGEYSRFQGLLSYAGFALLSISIAYSFRENQGPLAWGLGVAGGGVGLYHLIQMVGIDPTRDGDGVALVPSTASTIGNSNFVGGFLAIVFPIALHLWIRGGKSKPAGMLLTILIAEGIILSFSKGALAAALAGGLVLVGFHSASRFPRAKRTGLLAAALVAIGLVGTILASGSKSEVLPSASSRVELWKTATRVAATSPVWGHGPNAYFLESTVHRTTEDAVVRRQTIPAFSPVEVGYQASDDPHSLPLSVLANAGLVGLVGFLLAVGWLVRLGVRLEPSHHVAAAFFAATVAYLVQGSVSVDEPSLRLAGWASIGGLVAACARRVKRARSTTGSGRRPFIALGLAVAAVATAFVGIRWSYGFVESDHLAWAGSTSFMQGDPQQGERDLRLALSFRDEYAYRQLLAEHLGLTALEQGPTAAPLIARMHRVNTYLRDFPHASAMLGSARLLKYWSHHDPGAATAALELYERAERSDPNNPLVEVERAELLIDLGESDQATQLLEPLIDTPAAGSPDVWGALTMTRLASGDASGARIAADRSLALAPFACRSRIANELVMAEASDPPTPPEASAAAFGLAIACDRGMFEFFLRRLPSELRSLYGS